MERDFKTLQDRLINELKLHHIKSLDGANHYLKEEFIPKGRKLGYRKIKNLKRQKETTLEEFLLKK